MGECDDNSSVTWRLYAMNALLLYENFDVCCHSNGIVAIDSRTKECQDLVISAYLSVCIFLVKPSLTHYAIYFEMMTCCLLLESLDIFPSGLLFCVV